MFAAVQIKFQSFQKNIIDVSLIIGGEESTW